MGRSLVLMAKANPERNYVGIEVHVPGIAQCLYEAGMAELKTYVYLMQTRFRFYVKCQTTALTAYNFPDPWQKKRHFKRRFVIHERMQLVEQNLSLVVHSTQQQTGNRMLNGCLIF